MLGAETISIEIGGQAYELRPSLRASTRLVHQHGLPAMLAAVYDFNTIVIADMMKEATIKPAAFLEEIAATGLRRVRNRLTEPLEAFVLAIAGYDPDAAATTPAASSEALTHSEIHTRLFQIATGWLGWTPEQAWNATPAEIVAAHSGHVERLQAIHGKADEPDAPAPYSAKQVAELEANGLDPAFDREGLRALKAKMSA